ncbi:hypothetical protein KAH43_05540 [Candidatus Bipolaricaulota bacterium]|nr:hypothetical protein [Candidatus Bipolaricaulota bacterium]
MRQKIVALGLFILVVGASSFNGWTQGAEHFALEDVHLVSWDDLPEGYPSHTGPVSAAIIMAWHASHGYPQLLPDLNQDGSIDEDDTVLLAQEFTEQMVPDTVDGIYAPTVIDVLASHVGARYPDEFTMLIYDLSFPQEYHDRKGHPFELWRYPWIGIELLEDPSHENYTHHLEQQEPGIVGYGYEPEVNQFSVSRSFNAHEGPEGWPVDLVNTDRVGLGPESVWETALSWESNHWWFVSPEWIPFEIFIVLLPNNPTLGSSVPGDDPNETPPGGSSDSSGGDPAEPTPPGGSTSSSSGGDSTSPEPPPGSWDDGSNDVGTPGGDSGSESSESADVLIEMIRVGMGYNPRVDAAPGDQVLYNLYVWQLGPDVPRNIVAELRIPTGMSLDWIEGNPTYDWREGNPILGATSPENRIIRWEIDEMELQQATPGVPGTRGVDLWLQWLQVTVEETACGPLQFTYNVSSTTPDPDLSYNVGSLTAMIGPCDPESEPEGETGEDPAPTTLPNLWVTNVTGCWDWSDDGQEHVIATVTGIIHNGGKATASGVRARVTAGCISDTVYVGTILAGSQKTVSATLDIGAYDGVSWPVPTSITADPSDTVDEADESNNTTSSSFPESSECH